MIRKGNIAILATLDTKGAEVASMRGLLETLGYAATVIDIGSLGPPAFQADYPNDGVAQLGGWDLKYWSGQASGTGSWKPWGEGGKAPFPPFFRKRDRGVIGLGGNQGTAVSAMAMRVLPFGFPKYLVSTIASGNIRPYVGDRDIRVVFRWAISWAEPIRSPARSWPTPWRR